MHLVTFERVEHGGETTGGSRLGDAQLGFEALEFTRRGRRRLGARLFQPLPPCYWKCSRP